MSRTHILRLAVVLVVFVAVAVGGYVWWRDRSTFETTDNAFVETETVSISPQIEGYVAEILVEDNAHVTAGQVLARLDPVDARSRLNAAEARVAAARAALGGVDDQDRLEVARIAERQAGVESARAAAQQAELDMERYDALAGRGIVTEQRVQEARAGAAQSRAAVAQAEAALEAERRAAEALGSTRGQLIAEMAAAEATAEKARIDLDRTEIRAPISGVVGARSVRPGQYVRPGGQIMAVVPLSETYVIANFKETQVARLRIGQPVEIRADAFGGEVIHGRIESFAPATGQEFALIPVENAVGNFTKIAQRLPVRIAIERDRPLADALRAGLSVKVKVDVTVDSGASFAEAVRDSRVATGRPAEP